MSGATGAAAGGDAGGAQQPAGPGGPADPHGGRTSVMPTVPPAGPTGPPEEGYSEPTTYQKGTPAQSGARGPKGGGRGGRIVDAAKRAAAPDRRVPPRPTAPPTAGPAAQAGRTRRARLRVARTDPWSVMKVSFLLSIAAGVVTVVAVALLWLVLDAAGVFSSLGSTISDATGSGAGGGFDLQSFLSFGNVFLFTAVVAVIEVVLATALATLGAFIYNIAAEYTGGVEVTLAEED